MFILPKKVIKEVWKKLNSFLWKGSDHTTTGAKVRLDLVCNPKK